MSALDKNVPASEKVVELLKPCSASCSVSKHVMEREPFHSRNAAISLATDWVIHSQYSSPS